MASNGPGAGFYYKGDIYIRRTEIKLTDSFIAKKAAQGKKIWKYAWYTGDAYAGEFAFNYSKMTTDELRKLGYSREERMKMPNQYDPIFRIAGWEMDEAIEEIVRSEKLPKEMTERIMENIADPKTYKTNGEGVLWAIYIAVMIGSLIFNQFYLIWIAATLLFIWIKKGMK